jgi:hypothetical protein
MKMQGKVQDKRLIVLEETTQLVFRLISKGLDGIEYSVNCHAWNDLAKQLNCALPEGAICEVDVDREQKTGKHQIRSRRIRDARLIQMPKAELLPEPAPARQTPTAWGLWRPGHGWFTGVLPKRNGRPFQADKAVAFNEDNKKARPFLFDDCKDQQSCLKMAFGCYTIIKPLHFQ